MTDLPATIAVLREMHDARPYAPTRQRKALREAIEALEEAGKVVAGVDKWIDDLAPYADHGTAPAPVFQACKAWLDKWSSR